MPKSKREEEPPCSQPMDEKSRAMLEKDIAESLGSCFPPPLPISCPWKLRPIVTQLNEVAI